MSFSTCFDPYDAETLRNWMCGSLSVISNPRMSTNEHEAERGSMTRRNVADAGSLRKPERLWHDDRAAAHRAALRRTEFVLIRVHSWLPAFPSAQPYAQRDGEAVDEQNQTDEHRGAAVLHRLR